MGRLRIIISLLVVVTFILVVAIASIRVRDWTGIKVVVCIAMAFNFGSLIVIATDLDSPIRLGALAYLIGGCGWLLLVYLFPSIDAFFRSSLITPRLVEWFAPGPNPNEPKPDPAVESLHLLAHSLISILAGSLGAFTVFLLTSRYSDPDRLITHTTGLP